MVQTRESVGVWVDKNKRVHINEVVVDSTQVAAFIAEAPDDQRVQRLTDALEVGASCLERTAAGRDLDFVKRQVQEQVCILMDQVRKIPASLAVELKALLGTKDGQVLAPVAALIGTTEKVLTDKLASVHELLSKDLDPGRTDSTLGRALANIAGWLDPERDNSVQKSLQEAVVSVAGQDGAIASVLRKTLDAEFKPLREELDRLAKEVRAREAADGALAKTIEKGQAFEEELLPTLQCWGRLTGAAVTHVGGDCKPGDITVTVNDPTLTGGELVIVIEARDDGTGRGHKRIADHMAKAIKTRNGHYGIYVTKTSDGLAKEVGEWCEGSCSGGPFVACTADHLVTALRFAVVQTRIQSLMNTRSETDTEAIRREVDRIRSATRRLRTIKSKSSDIHKNADAVHLEADELQREIGDALLAIETGLRAKAAA